MFSYKLKSWSAVNENNFIWQVNSRILVIPVDWHELKKVIDTDWHELQMANTMVTFGLFDKQGSLEGTG